MIPEVVQIKDKSAGSAGHRGNTVPMDVPTAFTG